MAEDAATQGASGGTAQAGSQAPTSSDGSTGTQEGAAAPEATVKIGDEEVPVSQAQNALKVESEFTQRSQDASAREQALDAREQELMQSEVANQGLDDLAATLSAPGVREKVAEAVPEVQGALSQVANAGDVRLAAENLRLKLEKFVGETPDLTREELTAVRAEAVRLGKAGQLEQAQDFKSIHTRLHGAAIVQRQTQAAVDAALAEKTGTEQRQTDAATVGAGTAQIPGDVDIDKMTPLQKLSHGHRVSASQG